MGLIVKWISVLIVALLSMLIGYLAIFYQESLLGFALVLFWGLVLALVLHQIVGRSPDERWLRKVVLAGLVVRVPMVLAHLVVGFLVYKGQLDFPGYFISAVNLGRELLQGNIEEFFNMSDFRTVTTGTETVRRLLVFSYFFFGPSLAGAFFFSGILGFFGSYLFLRAFQAGFPSSRETRFLAASLFFFPSLAFWTSVIGKDSFAFFFLGLATYALAHIVRSPRPRYVFGLIVSLVVITLLRPPIGVGLTVAIGVGLVLVLQERAAAMLRPVLYIILGVLILGALAVVSVPMVRYVSFSEDASLVDNLLSLAVAQHVGTSIDAPGSGLSIQIRDPSVSEVVRFIPMGVFTFLFRPLVFEAHNVVAFVAALDGTFLLLLVLWRWRHLVAAIRSALSNPLLGFCGVAFLLFVTGLSFEANFGVIVRHRTMVLPFLFILLAVPREGRKAAPGSSHGG